MAGRALKRLADALDGLFGRGVARDFEAEVAGDGVDPGGIERNAAALDGGDQLPGAGVVRERAAWPKNLALSHEKKPVGRRDPIHLRSVTKRQGYMDAVANDGLVAGRSTSQLSEVTMSRRQIGGKRAAGLSRSFAGPRDPGRYGGSRRTGPGRAARGAGDRLRYRVEADLPEGRGIDRAASGAAGDR
jgi:hypothetical protein